MKKTSALGLRLSLNGDRVPYMEHKDPAREAIAAEVRASLARANQPASWLADRAGISKTALSLKLKAQRSFTVEELLSVADALGIDADMLLPNPNSAVAVAATIAAPTSADALPKPATDKPAS